MSSLKEFLIFLSQFTITSSFLISKWRVKSSTCTCLINVHPLKMIVDSFSVISSYWKNNNNTSFWKDGILSVTRKLDSCKARLPDNINIKMLKLCDKVIRKPSFKVFMAFILFTSVWKVTYVIPICKKKSKQLVQNYRLISSRTIYGKIFERFIHSGIYH